LYLVENALECLDSLRDFLKGLIDLLLQLSLSHIRLCESEKSRADCVSKADAKESPELWRRRADFSV